MKTITVFETPHYARSLFVNKNPRIVRGVEIRLTEESLPAEPIM